MTDISNVTISQRLHGIFQSPCTIDYGYQCSNVILGPLIKVTLTEMQQDESLFGPAVQSSIKRLQSDPKKIAEPPAIARLLDEELMFQNNEYFTLAFARPLSPFYPGTNGRCWAANIAPADLGGNFKRAIFIHGLVVKKARPVLLAFRTSPSQVEIEAALQLAVPDKHPVL